MSICWEWLRLNTNRDTGLNGQCGRMLALAIAFTIAGCEQLPDSREKLLSEGVSRTAEFALDFETLARCFERERDIPIDVQRVQKITWDTQVETDLAVARYEHNWWVGSRLWWLVIIEFRGIEPNKTAVKAYAISSDWLDINWKAIEGCATAIRPG